MDARSNESERERESERAIRKGKGIKLMAVTANVRMMYVNKSIRTRGRRSLREYYDDDDDRNEFNIIS